MSTRPNDTSGELVALLGTVRRRWFHVAALRAVGRSAMAAAAVVFGGVALDTIAKPDGSALVALAGATLLAAIAAVFAVLRRMHPRPDDRHVARFIEERAPADGAPLDDALVSAVEILEQPSAANSRFSGIVVGEAVRRLRAIDPSLVIDTRVLRGSWLEAIGGGVLLLAAAAVSAPSSWHAIDTARLLLFPGSITVAVLPGNARVPAGAPFRISATVRDGGRSLTRLVPTLTVTAGDEARTVEMRPSGEGFEFALESVDRSFRYRVTAGAARSSDYGVTALTPPRVRRIDLEYSYPAFTGLPGRIEEDGGDVYGPAGTRVRLTIQTDKPVTRGEIAFAGAAAALRPSGECLLVGDLVVTKDDAYRLRLLDEDGLRTDGDTEYFIRVMDDRPPDVRILRPSADQQITPLEEVAIEARADDDYGLAAFDLVYAVAGRPERSVSFDRVTGTDVEKVGARLLAAEELGVKPGDVISYYARARDIARGKRSTETRSDIFFLEVKPFNEEFVAAQSQASGATGSEIESLIAAQKEIISATWNLERRANAGRSAEDAAAVAKAQKSLKGRAEQLMRGAAGGRPQVPQRITPEPGQPAQQAAKGDPVANAVGAMGRAASLLDAQKTREAIAQEMTALNGLLQAQADVKRRQVSQGASGSGSGSNRAGQDLTALFDKELQRQQRTNYETRSSAEDKPARSDDALDRIRDLAKRQEDLSQRQRALAEAGLSPEEVKRQLEKLTREQTELRERAENLARQLSRPQQGSQQDSGRKSSGQQSQDQRQGGQQGQGAAGSMQSAAEQMRSAASDLRRDDARAAAQSGARAADQLRRAEERLRDSAGSNQGPAQLELEAQQIAQEQRRIAAEAERLEGSRGAAADEARRRIAEEKEQLATRVDEWKRAARRQGQDRRAGGDANALAATAEALDRERIAERMRESAQAMRGAGRDGKTPQASAARREQEIAGALERALKNVGGSRSAEARTLSEQLDRTREIRERLNRLEQEMRQAEAGQQGSRGRDGQQGRGGTSGDGQQAGDLKKLQQQYQRELERARDALGQLAAGQQRSGREMTTPEDQEFSRSAPGTEAFKQDRSGWESLRKQIDLSLEKYEVSISERLARRQAQDRLNGGGSERVPESYRGWIARYYESLARVRK